MPRRDGRASHRRRAGAGSAAIVAFLSLCAGCAPLDETARPASAATAAPIKEEALPGPIALAPSFTGVPATAPASPIRPAAGPAHAAAPRALPPASPTPPPIPAAAVVRQELAPVPIPASAPSPAPIPTAAPQEAAPAADFGLPQCPPGTVAMWSQPDVVGTRLGICHAIVPPR